MDYISLTCPLLQWMQGNIYREVFPIFLTKKSYGWWITRRRMEIYTKISEEKYLKVSVATIRKLQENTHALCKMAAEFSQQKADFAALRSWLSACSVWLPTCHKYGETLGGIPQHCAKWL